MQTIAWSWRMERPRILDERSPETLQPNIPLIDSCLNALSSNPDYGCLFAAKAGDLSHMRPVGVPSDTPLQVIAIPSERVADLQKLATAKTQVLNRHTIDLLDCRTFLSWNDGETHVEGVDSTALWGELGPVLRLFVTKQKSILVIDVFDEDFSVALQTAYACSGRNYHPHRIWSGVVLAKAATYAQENSLQGHVFDFDKEKSVIWLNHGMLTGTTCLY